MLISRKHLWEGTEAVEQINELKFWVELQYYQKTESGGTPKSVVYEVTFELIDYRPLYDFRDYVIEKIITKYIGQRLPEPVKEKMERDVTAAIRTKGEKGNGLDSLWRGFIVYSTLRMVAPDAVGWNVSKNEWYYYDYEECFKVRDVKLVSGEPKSNSQVKDAAKGTPDFKKFINALEKRNYKFVGIKPGGKLSGINPQKDRALLVSWLETFVIDYYLRNFESEVS